MANPLDSSTFKADSAIPSGSWTLYFRSPEETKWTLNTFISLGSMKTWGDFWTIIDTLKEESFSEGMFFLMRDPIPPLWENHQNIRGGYYSFPCQKKDAPDVYINYAIAAMLNSLSTNKENTINGISISPKRGFNIVKVWNTNAQRFHEPSDLTPNITVVTEKEINFTPFIQKKL